MTKADIKLGNLYYLLSCKLDLNYARPLQEYEIRPVIIEKAMENLGGSKDQFEIHFKYPSGDTDIETLVDEEALACTFFKTKKEVVDYITECLKSTKGKMNKSFDNIDLDNTVFNFEAEDEYTLIYESYVTDMVIHKSLESGTSIEIETNLLSQLNKSHMEFDADDYNIALNIADAKKMISESMKIYKKFEG